MQISSINSVNFRSNSIDVDFNDTKKDIEAARKLQKALKTDNLKNTEKSKKKNFFEVVASLATTFLVAFLMGKKLYKHGGELVNQLKNNSLKSKLQEKINISEAIKEITNTVKEKMSKIQIPESLKNNKLAKKLNELTPEGLKTAAKKVVETIKKHPDNAASILSAAAGTAYVATSDSDENGVADIAEKGVNAVKGAVQKINVISDAIETLT